MKLRIELDGRLYRIALSSPEMRNVLDAEGCRDLMREIHAAEADANVGAILLEADGHIFCAGCEPDEELMAIGRNITKPIIAAVQGVVLSGGLALAANAHVVIAAQGTSFGLTDIREGRFSAAILGAVARDRRAAGARIRIERQGFLDSRSARVGTGPPRRTGVRAGRPRDGGRHWDCQRQSGCDSRYAKNLACAGLLRFFLVRSPPVGIRRIN